jgi:sigma-B regulation protein RsbU (phosphoserine phosphatase)
MALSRTIIRTKAMSGVKPATVMARSNRLITKDSRSGLFVTAFYAILEIDSGKVAYTNGGHNRPLWLHASTGKIEELAVGGMVLGIFEQIKLGQGEAEVLPGDTLVFYTDGVTEAMNADDVLFGETQLRDTIAANAGADARLMMQAIIDAVNAFIGERPLADDFTICVAKRLSQ